MTEELAHAQAGTADEQPRSEHRNLLGFLVAGSLTLGCLWSYARLGGGAAGVLGVLLLATPVAGAWTVLLVPSLRRLLRGRWLGVSLGVVLPYLLASLMLPELMRRQAFDSHAWQEAARGHSETRIRQVDDLRASGRLDGSTRAAVLELLGPDDSVNGTGRGRGYFTEWDLVYLLGPMRGWIRIDSEWLVMRLDVSGRVAEHRIVVD